MNVIFYNLFSDVTLRLIAPFVLVIIGAVIETRYVGRVAMFSNAAALYIFYHPINMALGLWLIVNSVILIGLAGGISRLLNIPLVTQFYKVAWIASSVVTGILLLYGLTPTP